MASLGTAYVQVRGDLSNLNKQLVANFHPAKLGKLGKGAGLAIGAGLGAGLAGVTAGKALFDIGSQFDEQFDKIRVGTGKTGKSLKGLEDDFKNVLRTTPSNMEDVGTAVTELNRRLGLTGKPLQQFSRQMTNLSRITDTDLTTNVEEVARAFEDWDVPVQRQSEALDGLFRLGQKSGASVADLAGQIQKFGSPLRLLGFTLGEAAATFATFERAGVNTQTMVPGLKLAIANLTKPTADLSKSMAALGIEAGKPEEGLKKVFALLGDNSNLSRAEKTGLAMEVFGKRAGADMAEAVRQGRFEVDEMLKAFDKGDSINKASRDTEDFSEKWKRLKNTILVGIEPIASRFFDSVTRDMEKVGKILSDPKLSTSEKWDKIGDVLSERLERGIDVAADAAAALAPKVASAFLKGFVQAPALVQLLAGAWVFAKGRKLLAAFGLLGTQAGASFGTGLGTGAAGGAAAGGAAGAAGGLAGLSTKLRAILPRLGFAAVGITAADLILKNMKIRMDSGSKDLTKRLDALTATPELDTLDTITGPLKLGGLVEPLFTSDDQKKGERLKAILDQVKNSRRGITAEAANEATKLARNLDLTRQQRRVVQETLDLGRQKAALPVFDLAKTFGDMTKAGKITPDFINQISAQLETLPAKTRPKFAQAVLDWSRELKKTGQIKGSLAQLRNVIASEVDGVGRLSLKGPNLLRQRMAAGFESMVKAVADPTSRMARIVQSYLDAFGEDKTSKVISGALAKDKAVRGKGFKGGLARGGFLGGKGRHDTIPIMAAPGEAVLNRHQQQPVETALRTTYGYGLQDLFKKEKRPHYMARGGFVGRERIIEKTEKPLPVERLVQAFKTGGVVRGGRGRLQLPASFTSTHPTSGLEGYPAVDVFAPAGTPVLSPVTGRVTRFSGKGGTSGQVYGVGMYIQGGDSSYFLTHMGKRFVDPGDKIRRGQLIGTVSAWDGGATHIHLGRSGGKAPTGGGVGSDAIDIPRLGKVKISGGTGVHRDLAEAASEKVRKAAQSFMEQQAPAGPDDSGVSHDLLSQGDGNVSRTIYEVGRSMGASPKVMLAAFEAAIVESGLRNLSYGDRDSLGVFQQRPSQGWGSVEQITNPAYAARQFFSRAIKTDSSGMTAGQLAQSVQRSAFPARYDAVRGQATAILRRYGVELARGGFVPRMAMGGMVERLREFMPAASGLSPKATASKKKEKSTKPKTLKLPRKNFKIDRKALSKATKILKGKKTRKKPKDGDGFQLKQLDFLDAAIDKTIPGIQDRIEGIEFDFDLAAPEHFPDERVVPRLKREGHNIEKLGDSFVDWSAVEQSKGFLNQILGESFRLIGTPFGAGKGVMEIVKDAFPSLDASVAGIVERLNKEIAELKEKVRENLREMRRHEKRIETLDEKIDKEGDKKKPDRDKMKAWRKEKGERQDKVDAIRKSNRALTGESDPTGSLDDWSKGRLGTAITRHEAADTALTGLRDQKESFLGTSGVGGEFASVKRSITQRVKDRDAITTERIKEQVGPTKAETNTELKAFFGAISELVKTFGPNFRRFQRGGIVRGFGDGDKIPVLAEPGEGFINKRAVMKMGGPKEIERINRLMPRFQTGGVVASPVQVVKGERGEMTVVKETKAQVGDKKVVLNEYHGPVTQVLPEDMHNWSRDAEFQIRTAV